MLSLFCQYFRVCVFDKELLSLTEHAQSELLVVCYWLISLLKHCSQVLDEELRVKVEPTGRLVDRHQCYRYK